MPREHRRRYKVVVIGVSTGGVEALRKLLGALPVDFLLPVLAVAHIAPESGNGLALLLNDICSIRVKEADESEPIVPGTVYLAPPNYHLQLEHDQRLSLSVDTAVNFARPSVDVLFETASDALGSAVIGVMLTGVGSDGSKGLKKIKDAEGCAVVQDPSDAEADSMPKSALSMVMPDYILPLERIAGVLIQLAGEHGGVRSE